MSKSLRKAEKLNNEDLEKINGGYLYASGSENGYRLYVIDDKTGETIAEYYYFEIEEAEDMARNTNNSDKWISWEEVCALRGKSK